MKLISSVLVGLGSATHNSGSYSWYDYSDWYTNSLSDWSSQWYNSVYDWSSMYSNYYSSGSKVSKWHWSVRRSLIMPGCDQQPSARDHFKISIERFQWWFVLVFKLVRRSFLLIRSKWLFKLCFNMGFQSCFLFNYK